MRWQPDDARLRITLLAVAPATLLLAADAFQLSTPRIEADCWVLPNARVLHAPSDRTCPIRSEELVVASLHGSRRSPVAPGREIDWGEFAAAGHATLEVMGPVGRATRRIEVRPQQRGQRVERQLLGGLFAVGLLAIPLFVLWTSRAAAAPPIALLYGVAASIGIGAGVGPRTGATASAMLLASCLAPALLTHLALVFPRARPSVRSAPQLRWIVYVPLLGFAGLGLVVLHALPAVWPAYVSVLLGATASAWLAVVVACAIAARESRSQLERARSRTLTLGALLLPIGPTFWIAAGSSDPRAWLAAYVASATLTLPAPIALAITSYNLFDVGWDARRWLGRALVLSCTAGLAAAALHGVSRLPAPPSVGVTLTWAGGLAIAVETVRNRLFPLIESALHPRTRRLRTARDRFAQDATALRDTDGVTRLLASAVRENLDGAAVCVALRPDASWRVSIDEGLAGETPAAVLRAAERIADGSFVAHLARESFEESVDAERLRARGVEVVAAIRAGARPLALLLVATRAERTPYSGVEIGFLRSLCSYAAAALENSRLANELVAAERRATTGRIAVALAHDIGKELAWIAELASRLPDRAEDPRRLGHEADQIGALAETALRELHDFVTDASSPPGDPRQLRVHEAVAIAVAQATRRHPAAQISATVDPTLRRRRVDAAVTRVLANAIENGVLASPLEPIVEVLARADGDHLHFEVSDRGCGMAPGAVARACEPGFTSRRAAGGLGMGLAAACEIVTSLSGRLSIESAPGCGTRVSVVLPNRAVPA